MYNSRAVSFQETALFCKKISDRKIRILRIDFTGHAWQNGAIDSPLEICLVMKVLQGFNNIFNACIGQIRPAISLVYKSKIS